MRVLQLEHNTNVLLQELSDMHEHADKTRRDHAAQITALHALQEDIAQERATTIQLRRDMSEQCDALTKAEAEARAAHSEIAQLQERIAVMDNEVRKLAMEAAEKSGAAMQDVQRQLTDERGRSASLVKCIAGKDSEIARILDDNEVFILF